MRTSRYTYGRSASSGFTLIELLVVIGIIGLLIGITLVVGQSVMNGAKRSATQDTIRVLDSAMEAYVNANNAEIPAPTVPGLDPAKPNEIFLAADARDMGTAPIPPGYMINSVSVFMYQASKVPNAKAVLDKLPAKYVRLFDADASGPQPPLLTVFDAWGEPIRYVHPTFQGNVVDDPAMANPSSTASRQTDKVVGPAAAPQTYAMLQIRRNHLVPANAVENPDSDGGSCQGTRPYFYSSGSDKLVGWRMNQANTGIDKDYNVDNVYTTVPKLAK